MSEAPAEPRFQHSFHIHDGTMEVHINVLADKPELAGAVGTVCYDEWPEMAAKDFGLNSGAEFAADLRARFLHRDAVPLVLVATAAATGELVATVTLHPCDMPAHRPLLSPWMSCMVVLPAHRRQGVAAHLVQCLHQLVHQIGLPEMWLWTGDSVALYKRYGWEVVEEIEYFEEPAIVMRLDTTKPPNDFVL